MGPDDDPDTEPETVSPIAGIIAVAVVASVTIIVLGWVQTVHTRKATRAGLERASGNVTDAQLLGLVTRQPPDERVRATPVEVAPDEVQDTVDRLRPDRDQG